MTSMLIRREQAGDEAGIRSVVAAAFAPTGPEHVPDLSAAASTAAPANGGGTADPAADGQVGGVGPAAGTQPVEAWLVDALRADPGWIAQLSFVAVDGGGQIVGHVVCTRATLTAPDGPSYPVLGLGPLAVRPDV